MNVRLAITDALFDLYVVHAGGDEARALSEMAVQLDRFRMIRPMDRILVLGAEARAQLEELLPNPLPQIKDAKDLIQRINALADLEIGGVRVKFTPKDLESIARSAEKNGLSVQEACQATVDHMKQHFLSYVGDATARAAMLPVVDEETPPELPDDPEPEDEEIPTVADPALEALRSDAPAVRPKHPGASLQPEEQVQPGSPAAVGRLLNPREEEIEEDDEKALAKSFDAPEPSAQERQAALRAPVPPGVRAPTAAAFGEKLMPRRPQPKIHKRRKVVVETPARDGGDVRPAGWGAGSLASLQGGGEE
jgi:hypothetical protein